MKYAAETTVPVEKSRAEIESALQKYGASEFMSGWKERGAMVAFKMNDRLIRFTLPLPDSKDKRFTEYERGSQTWLREDSVARKLWEQACRQAWRALLLVIKAKLEAVDSSITTFEAEFMAQIVLPTGKTIGETILPNLPAYLEGAKMPPLLPQMK